MTTVNLEFFSAAIFPTGTVVLNFGQLLPPPALPDGNLGIWVDMAWLPDAVPHEVATEIVVGSLSKIGSWTDISIYTPVATDAEISLPWRMPASHDAQIDLSFTGNDNPTLGYIETAWGILGSITQYLDVNWSAYPALGIQYNIDWTNNVSVAESLTDLAFATNDILAQQCDILWHSGALGRWANPDIVWGPHKGRLICSTDAPLIKGVVTLRFSDEAVTPSPGAIVMRFTPSPQYCYWDDGGGPINNTPDLPNFDFDVPIEPQIKRVYLMQPTLTVIRLSDNMPIIVTGVSISSTRGMFTKTGSIDFASRGDCDRAMNQLLLITINGYEFYAVPEEKNHRQTFNSTQYSASFRSKTSELSQPWKLPISYSNNTNRSLAGIMGDILQDTGWTVELVGFLDFNIPEKVFSITGKGPIESVNEMADMLGCMIVEDELENNLKIVPYWPATPWNIGETIAAINIHAAVISNYSAVDEINEQCNTCWVRGEQQGVSRQVKLTGSAGNIPTADISNKLIVTDTAARLAGTKAIADTGQKEKVSVSLPVMGDLPPLVKGMVIGVTHFDQIYKAICDSTTISATVTDDGIDVVQSAVLIRHTGE